MNSFIISTSLNRCERPARQVVVWGFALSAVLTLSGCVRYEFDVVQPPDLARHIGAKWENARWGPVDYRLRTVENHLVIEVQNVMREEIRILGDRSYVVGPDGQSHPLASQTIAPESFMRLVLPPVPRVYQQSGPRMGIGLGVGFSSGRHGRGRYYGGGGFYDPWDHPRYLAVYDGAAWDWPGEGEARLNLTMQVGPEAGQIVTHAFTIRKKKV